MPASTISPTAERASKNFNLNFMYTQLAQSILLIVISVGIWGIYDILKKHFEDKDNGDFTSI